MNILNRLILKYCETRITEHEVKVPRTYYNERSETYVKFNRTLTYYTIEYKLFNRWFILKPRTNGNRYKFYSQYSIKKYLEEPILKFIETYKGNDIYIENIYYNYHDYFISDIKLIRIEEKYRLGKCKYLYDSLEEVKEEIDRKIAENPVIKSKQISYP